MLTDQLTAGLPQGSPLSPLLFAIYVNDLLTGLNDIKETDSQAYADDILSHWKIAVWGSSERQIVPQLETFPQQWSCKWRLSFSTDKCKLLAIGRIQLPLPSFHIGETTLEYVPSLKYLGVWFDSTLSWREHIRHASDKALTRLRVLCGGMKTTWGFHPIIARRMIDATILPILFYAAPIWCTALRSTTTLAPINRVLRQCALATMGLYRTVSTDAALFVAGIKPADIYIRQKLMDFYLRELSYSRDLLRLVPPPLLATTLPPQSTFYNRNFVTSRARPISPLKAFARWKLLIGGTKTRLNPSGFQNPISWIETWR